MLYTLNVPVYWVTDNKGIRHLCHDFVYAQHLEAEYKRERNSIGIGGEG